MELNRDEIIKALECCYTNTLSCIDCPYQAPDKFLECSDLVHNAVSLVKELTEENANWEPIAEGYRKQFEDCAEERGKLTEENERLKTELRQTAQKLKAVEEVNEKLTADVEWAQRRIIDTDKKVARLREEIADNIKRFADRLKRYYDANDKYLGYSIAYNIDRVAEELIKGAGAPDNKCVACGETIPEGRQVCPGCEGGKINDNQQKEI